MVTKMLKKILSGLFRYEEPTKGWVVKVKNATNLVAAAERVRNQGVKSFDCFSPFPIHGLETAMGLKRSWIPFITLCCGLMGTTAAISLMVYTMVIDWPQIYGGKPYFSWPAFIPITFELTILLGGLGTVAGVIFLGRLGDLKREPVIKGITSDTCAIWIGDDISQSDVEQLLDGLVEEIKEVKVKAKQ